jgi:hypothetical protein
MKVQFADQALPLLIRKIQDLQTGKYKKRPRLHTFYYYRLLRKSNVRKMKVKFIQLKAGYNAGKIAFDEIYDFCEEWLHYASYANTYNLRK